MLEVGVPQADAAEADPGGLRAAAAEIEQAPLAAGRDLHRPAQRPVQADQLDVLRSLGLLAHPHPSRPGPHRQDGASLRGETVRIDDVRKRAVRATSCFFY
jgi:hypothetical protein